jgi:hypothetical protein
LTGTAQRPAAMMPRNAVANTMGSATSSKDPATGRHVGQRGTPSARPDGQIVVTDRAVTARVLQQGRRSAIGRLPVDEVGEGLGSPEKPVRQASAG